MTTKTELTLDDVVATIDAVGRELSHNDVVYETLRHRGVQVRGTYAYETWTSVLGEYTSVSKVRRLLDQAVAEERIVLRETPTRRGVKREWYSKARQQELDGRRARAEQEEATLTGYMSRYSLTRGAAELLRLADLGADALGQQYIYSSGFYSAVDVVRWVDAGKQVPRG